MEAGTKSARQSGNHSADFSDAIPASHNLNINQESNMMEKTRTVSMIAALIACLGGSVSPAMAETSMLQSYKFEKPEFLHPHPFAKAHVVLQVSEDNPQLWGLTLNNITNLMAYFGPDNVQIVMVAYGPGLKMLFADSPVAERIKALDAQGVEFDACNVTITGMTKTLGHRPNLVDASAIVPGGIVRIMQLQQHHFDYIKP